MKKYFLLLALVAIAPIFQAEAVQVFAPSPRAMQQGQIGQAIGQGIGIRWQQQQMQAQQQVQQEQMELMRRQVKAQEEMLRAYRNYR